MHAHPVQYQTTDNRVIDKLSIRVEQKDRYFPKEMVETKNRAKRLK